MKNKNKESETVKQKIPKKDNKNYINTKKYQSLFSNF